MYTNSLLRLTGYFSLVLSLVACDSPAPVAPPAVVCQVTSATEQVTQDTPPTLTLQRSFTYANGQLTHLAERTATQQANYQLDYQDGKLVRATGNSASMMVERDAVTGRISRVAMMNGMQTQASFTLSYTGSGQLSRLTEIRLMPVTGSSVVGRVYSFSYTNAGNVSTEEAVFTFQNGSTLYQETDYTVGSEASLYAKFPERTLLTALSVGQQFEAHPGRLWLNNALTGYQTYTLNGTNRLLAESATFANQFDATGHLLATTQTTKYYSPVGSTFAVTKPTSHTFAYECK